MENFAPGLRESILSLTDALRAIVFFVCVVGLVLQIQQARADMEGFTRPFVRATVIVGLVATLPSDLTVRPQNGRNDEQVRFPGFWRKDPQAARRPRLIMAPKRSESAG